MKQPEAYIDFEVYEDSVNLIGIASVSLPSIAYMTAQITGAGVTGTVETPLSGMIQAMTTTINFRDPTVAAARLGSPKKHQIELRAVKQNWNTSAVEKELSMDKYVMTVVPKTMNPGTVAPASAADSSSEYSVYYYAAYQDGRKKWEIDPFNQICEIDGVDYCADIRTLLGK